MSRVEKNYKYEFMPSNLEIIEKPPTPLGGAIIYIISIAIVIFVVLSFVFQIDIVVTSTGTVDVEDGIKIVNSNSSNKIVKINKKQGDDVKKDDVILELENKNKAEIEGLEKEINLLSLEKDILSTKIDKIKDDTIFNKYVIDNTKLNEYQLEYEIYWNNIIEEERQYNESINELNDKSFENDITSEEIDQIYKEKNQLLIDRKQSIDDENLNVIMEFNIIKERIEESNKELDQLKRDEENNYIKSPSNGNIVVLNYHTIGSYINPSMNIAEIIPNDSKFIIKTKIENKNISKVKVGQIVTVKIDAYDYQTFGGIQGKIRFISATSILSEDKSSLNYEIEIEMSNTNNKIKLKPGMTVSLDIKTGRKKIIEYVFEPIMKTVDEAF